MNCNIIRFVNRFIFFSVSLVFATVPFAASGGVSLLPSAAGPFFAGTKHVIAIHGEIRPGDYDRFVEALRKWRSLYADDLRVPAVILTSPGGDAKEAIRIGRAVRQLSLHVKVPSTVPFRDGDPKFKEEGFRSVENVCNSACFLIYIAGAERSWGSVKGYSLGIDGGLEIPIPIGVHRPYFDPVYFAGINSEEARHAYQQMEAEVRDYLRSMGLSEGWIETVFSTPSSRVRRLTHGDAHEIGTQESSWEEWLHATCGGSVFMNQLLKGNKEAASCISRTVNQERIRLVDEFLN